MEDAALGRKFKIPTSAEAQQVQNELVEFLTGEHSGSKHIAVESAKQAANEDDYYKPTTGFHGFMESTKLAIPAHWQACLKEAGVDCKHNTYMINADFFGAIKHLSGFPRGGLDMHGRDHAGLHVHACMQLSMLASRLHACSPDPCLHIQPCDSICISA